MDDTGLPPLRQVSLTPFLVQCGGDAARVRMPTLTDPEEAMAPEPDLREWNLSAVFDMFDTDRDGYITEDNLTAAGRRVLDEFQITGDQQRAEFLALYRPVYEQLSADLDSDSDSRISRQEFVRAFADGLGDPQAYYQRLFGPSSKGWLSSSTWTMTGSSRRTSMPAAQGPRA